MGRKPKDEIMSFSEMQIMNEERKLSRLFSKDADAGERISELVHNARCELSRLPKKINLQDTMQVRAIVGDYLRSCDEVGIVPSKTGVSRAMGLSTHGIRNFMICNPEHDTTKFLEIVFDMFSEILNSAALSGASHPIYSIFLQKAVYGLRDNFSVEILHPQASSINSASGLSAAEIAEKYSDLPDD